MCDLMTIIKRTRTGDAVHAWLRLNAEQREGMNKAGLSDYKVYPNKNRCLGVSWTAEKLMRPDGCEIKPWFAETGPELERKIRDECTELMTALTEFEREDYRRRVDHPFASQEVAEAGDG